MADTSDPESGGDISAADPDEHGFASGDGRRARRARNRTSVIDALFRLLHDGVTSPSAEEIAAGAGLSVSSLFRYFQSLEDLHEQTIAAHFERHRSLFELRRCEGSIDARIERLVGDRMSLYTAVAPVARLARSQALTRPRIAAALDETRLVLSRQARFSFENELAVRPCAQADEIVDLIDTVTSFESWDLLNSTKGRADIEIRRTWIRGIGSVIA